MGGETEPGRSPGGLTEQEQELLRALAVEPTMAHVARRMGTSTRHARRLISSLLAKLGVDHVRAAVALGVARGWITVGGERVDWRLSDL